VCAYYLVLPTKGTTLESEDAVSKYLLENQLQKPEETILQELRTKPPKMKILDIGVEAIRTRMGTLDFFRSDSVNW
jgi:hypothetical protein